MMKNTKQLLVIASIAVGITLKDKPAHAQQIAPTNIPQQIVYNYSNGYTKTLKLGDRSSIVKHIQSTLNLYFAAGLAEDGIYGNLTKETVKDVQRKLNIRVDGIFGPQTAKSILNYIGNNQVDDKDGFSPISFIIQKKLVSLGYNISINGNLFSSDTISAIKDFQRKNNIYVDGKVDTKMLNKMNERIKQITNETKKFKSDTDYYILINSNDHVCSVYEKKVDIWREIRCFNVLSGKVNKGNYTLGIKGKELNFNGISMNNFTQIYGLNVFYSAISDTGYGIRVSQEDATFLSKIPIKTTVNIF